MMSGRSDVYRHYNDYFNKVVNEKVTAPKPKYIRKIILKTYDDNRLHNFFSVLSLYNRSLKPVYYLKLFILVHNIMRDGNVGADMWERFSSYFSTNLPTNIMRNVYYEMTVAYGVYLKYKSNFHKRAPHFKGNMKTAIEGDVLPFSELSDCLTLLTMIMLYFQAVCFLLDKLIAKVHTGFNLSLTKEGQCTLFPLCAVAMDAMGVYDALCIMFERLLPVLPGTELEVPLTQFQETYVRYRRQMKIIGTYSYLNSFLSIPAYPESLPWDPANLKRNSAEPIVQPTVAPVDEKQNEDELLEELKRLRIQNKILEQNYNDLVAHSKKFKALFVEKYNTDVTTLNNQIRQLMEENESSALLLENMKRMDHTRDLDERFEKLKNLYFQLRKEYAESNAKLMMTETDMTKLTKEIEEKKTKISDLTKVLDEATEKADLFQLDAAKKELELAKLKSDLKCSSEGSADKVTRLNQELQFVTQKHKDVIREYESRIEQLQEASEGSSLAKYIIALFLEKLNDIESSLSMSGDTQATPAEMKRALSATIQMMDGYVADAEESKYDSSFMGLIFKISSQFFEVLRTMRGVANTCSAENSLYIMGKFNELVCSLREILKLVECNDLSNYQFKMYQLLRELQALLEYANTLPEITVHAESTPEDVIFHTKGRVMEATSLLHHVIEHAEKFSAGQQLMVDPKILEDCKLLLSLVDELIDDSANLQKEIIDSGGNMSEAKSFYKKHHRWTEGLISAAKAIGGSAFFLVHTADKVINGAASLEELIVASGDITASTASLVASSHTKADPYSKLLEKLISTSSRVNRASNQLVSGSKAAISKRDECTYVDITNVSSITAKRLEMNSQIRVLELEAELERERNRLLSLRTDNYHRESGSTDGTSYMNN